MSQREVLTLTVLRRKAGLTQEELALAIEKTQPDISLYENGEKMPAGRGAEILSVLRRELQSLDPRVDEDDLQRPYDEVVLKLAGLPGAV